MSDRTSELIGKIRGQVNSLHTQYISERSKSEQLAQQLSEMEALVKNKDSEINELIKKIASLNAELETAKDQRISSEPIKEGLSDAEIDELVKEIDYCVKQLKE